MPPSPDRRRSDALLPSLGGTLGFGEPATEPFCDVCNRGFATPELYALHLPGATHKMCLAKMGTRTLFGCGDHYAHISKLLEPVKPRQTSHDD